MQGGNDDLSAPSPPEADALRREEKKVYVQSKTDLEQGLQGVRTRGRARATQATNHEVQALIKTRT